MKHKLFCTPVLLLLLLSAPLVRAVQPTIPDWLPLQAGNEWTLTATNGDTRTIQLDSASDGTVAATGLFDEPVTLRLSTGGNLQARATGRSGWKTVARFGTPDNRSWHFNLTGDQCDNTRAVWSATDTTIVAPVGSFDGCRRWQGARVKDPGNVCPAPATSAIWFAPGVGPVGLQTGTGEWFWLTSAIVGDVLYPPPPNGLEAQLTTDQSVYTNVSNHLIICPPCRTNNPPCAVACYLAGGTNATALFNFQVTNASGQPQTFTFPTGQTFDIQLIDTNGIVVARWSTGKAFPNIATTLVLPPSESLTYPASMELVDATGQPLRGPYIARAYLTNAGAPAGIAATAQFQVIYELVPAPASPPPAGP